MVNATSLVGAMIPKLRQKNICYFQGTHFLCCVQIISLEFIDSKQQNIQL